MSKAVILLSGGIDSATILAMAKEAKLDIYAITFRYGQRHEYEIEKSKILANHFSVHEHIIVDIDISQFGESILTSRKVVSNPIRNAYVPARNTIFLSYALGWAEVISATHILIGANAMDCVGYPDCRPEYISAFQELIKLLPGKIEVNAPLILDDKSRIIERGLQLGVDYSMTTSCYDPIEGEACGECTACEFRLAGFDGNSIKDPIKYRNL